VRTVSKWKKSMGKVWIETLGILAPAIAECQAN